MTYVTLTDLNGKQFRATEAQAEALESLKVARAGGIATIYGYQPKSDYVKDKHPTQDMQILTRFSTKRLYERKMEALSEIRFSDIEDGIANDPVLKAMDRSELLALFNTRKASEVESMAKTLSGDRSDAHRQGHDRCYASVADGIKVNYETQKDSEGLEQPVLTEGLPTVASILVHYLELNKTVRVPGEYKVVNSKAPVRISNLINKQLNAKSVGIKQVSLKEDNFERLIVDRKSYLPEDVAKFPADILAD